jgi:cytochrome c55X
MLKASLIAALAATCAAAAGQEPTPERGAALKEFVRQDCGFCHGLNLTGGLGPSLQPDALADRPVDYLSYVILNGMRGRAMPGWQPHLSEPEARWIAEQLKKGLVK